MEEGTFTEPLCANCPRIEGRVCETIDPENSVGPTKVIYGNNTAELCCQALSLIGYPIEQNRRGRLFDVNTGEPDNKTTA